MRFLFIHQNFPGQFRHVANFLADDPANEIVGIGEARNLRGRPPLHPKIRVLGYQSHGKSHRETHHYLRDYEAHIRRGQSVARLLLQFRDKDKFKPDVVVAHPSWGEGLFLKDIFPEARHIHYFEYFYHSKGGDLGFDPEFPANLDDQLRVRIKNSTLLQSLVACDQGISPTNWQKSRFPAELQSKIEVVHEGVDTETIGPNPGAWIEINAERFIASGEIVTYVARNLEPYRGFHIFMRMLPKLQALQPNARILIVGGDDVSYGRRLPDGKTYQELYSEEVRERVDWRKVHFLGYLPYAAYLKVLQVSAAHIYLTYPFVLSWSMLEAMATGCLVIGSRTAPVEEVIVDGHNGLLVDFFDSEGLANLIAEVLANPSEYAALRSNAQRTIGEHYDLRRICLPRMLEVLRGGI
jgi:glycosyltransferase involved in cell wall biosynthesis